ncbi:MULTISPECIES: hypothetical protein [unclassified Nocardia]|uniref:hypothetical protein n=1 Tax=unclassified Nocardia TaxID=2637762 RepID=UPI001CE3EF01|nr:MULTISPECIES: hypothetical protein [unclassified Nocardia]
MSATLDRLNIIETCTRMAWYADHREWERLGEIWRIRAVVMTATWGDGNQDLVG